MLYFSGQFLQSWIFGLCKILKVNCSLFAVIQCFFFENWKLKAIEEENKIKIKTFLEEREARKTAPEINDTAKSKLKCF